MQTTNFIPEHIDTIGVMVSGGIDSALLLYLVAEEIKTLSRPVELIACSVYRHDGAKKFSTQVVETVQRLTSVNIKNVVVGNPNAHSNKVVQTGVMEATLKHTRFVLMASTAVPEHLKNADAPIRDPNNYKAMHQPWVHTLKDQVIKYIVEHNLYDLAIASHSCTSLSQGRCGKCFNCLERDWAFTVNNAVDPGVD